MPTSAMLLRMAISRRDLARYPVLHASCSEWQPSLTAVFRALPLNYRDQTGMGHLMQYGA
jgi:hypothetical protein